MTGACIKKWWGMRNVLVAFLSTAEARRLVETHKAWLMHFWTGYSPEAHMGLEDMCVADERFAMYYDQRVKGGAAFLREAIRRWAGQS